mgnify:CR=1 FL=1
MTDTQEYPWIKHYPKGVPATINPDIYESLPDFQEKICQEYGDAPVFTSLGKTMTYKEFDEKVTAFASYLQSLPGVEQGDRVAVMMPNLLQYPICLFGIMKPDLSSSTSIRLHRRELGGQLKDSGAKVLVIIENFAKTFEKIQKDSPVEHVITTQVGDLLSAPKRLLVNFMLKKVKKMVPEFNLEYAVSFRDALAQGASRKFNPVKLDRYDIALLQYTGGTTGIAKRRHAHAPQCVGQLAADGCLDFRRLQEEDRSRYDSASALSHLFSDRSVQLPSVGRSHGADC